MLTMIFPAVVSENHQIFRGQLHHGGVSWDISCMLELVMSSMEGSRFNNLAIQSWVATPVGNIWKSLEDHSQQPSCCMGKNHKKPGTPETPGQWKAQRSQKEPKWDRKWLCSMSCKLVHHRTSGHPSYDKFQSTHISVSVCRRPKTFAIFIICSFT